MILRIFILLISLFFAKNSSAITDTFQEGVSSYSGTREIIISSNATTSTVTGAESGTYFIRSFTNNTDRGLLYFDISSISSTATVSSAVLTIKVRDANCFVHTIVAKQIEDPDASGPFTQDSVASNTNNTYGDYLYKNDTTNLKWEVAGAAANFADVDDNSSEGSFTTTDCPAGYESKTLTITNMVQSWVTIPGANAGMYIYSTRAASASVDMLSKFNATSSNRPLLTVTYTVPSTRRVMTVQ